MFAFFFFSPPPQGAEFSFFIACHFAIFFSREYKILAFDRQIVSTELLTFYSLCNAVC